MAISLGSGFFTVKAKDEATDAVRGMGANVRASLADLASTALTSMAVAGTAVLGFVGSSVKAFADSEAAHAQLEAALRSTGNAAGLSAGELDKYAAAAQRTTTYEDDAVTAAQALMLTFTNIGRDVFPQAMTATLDMSTAMGQDLKSSVIQIGKALNDPIKGITALTRVGVTFTEQQKAMIEYLVMTGDTIGAQKMILAELSKEFGGSATAAAQTFSGQLKQMWNQFGDLQEQIGEAFIPVLKDLLERLKPVITAIGDWITKNPDSTTQILEWAAGIGAASIALRAIMPLFTAVGSAIAAVATALELPVVAVAAVVAALVFAGYEIITNWDKVKEFFSEFWEKLKSLFETEAKAVGELLGWAVGKWIEFMTDPLKFITEAWEGLIEFFGWLWEKISSIFNWAVSNIIDPVIEKAKELFQWLTAAFSQGFNEGLAGGLGTASSTTPGMATGGRVGRGGPVLVGERGPELLFLPRGAEVLPAQATAGLLNGGGAPSVSINFNGLVIRQEADIDLIVRKMGRELESTLSRRGMRLRPA